MKCQPAPNHVGNITSHIVKHDPRSLGNKEPLAIVAVGEALDDLGYLRLVDNLGRKVYNVDRKRSGNPT